MKARPLHRWAVEFHHGSRRFYRLRGAYGLLLSYTILFRLTLWKYFATTRTAIRPLARSRHFWRYPGAVRCLFSCVMPRYTLSGRRVKLHGMKESDPLRLGWSQVPRPVGLSHMC